MTHLCFGILSIASLRCHSHKVSVGAYKILGKYDVSKIIRCASNLQEKNYQHLVLHLAFLFSRPPNPETCYMVYGVMCPAHTTSGSSA